MACSRPTEESEAATVAPSEPITLLLVGKTGAGKSCLGNRLLGYSAHDDRHPPFKVSADVDSETSDMKMVDGFFCGETSRPIRVVDCPGLADSDGHDDRFAPMLSDMMKKTGHVNVLLWCRNGQEDRIDINEWHQLIACRDLFGTYLFSNMVMNLSKWSHDEKSEKRRHQSGRSFFSFRNRMWEKATDHAVLCNTNSFPVFTLDAMYDVDDEIEVTKFNEIKEEMWKCFLDLELKPVFTKEVLQQQIEKQKAEQEKVKREKEEEEREKIEAAVNTEVEKLKKEQKAALEKLHKENQGEIDAKVKMMKEEQERSRRQLESSHQQQLSYLQWLRKEDQNRMEAAERRFQEEQARARMEADDREARIRREARENQYRAQQQWAAQEMLLNFIKQQTENTSKMAAEQQNKDTRSVSREKETRRN